MRPRDGGAGVLLANGSVVAPVWWRRDGDRGVLVVGGVPAGVVRDAGIVEAAEALRRVVELLLGRPVVVEWVAALDAAEEVAGVRGRPVDQRAETTAPTEPSRPRSPFAAAEERGRAAHSPARHGAAPAVGDLEIVPAPAPVVVDGPWSRTRPHVSLLGLAPQLEHNERVELVSLLSRLPGPGDARPELLDDAELDAVVALFCERFPARGGVLDTRAARSVWGLWHWGDPDHRERGRGGAPSSGTAPQQPVGAPDDDPAIPGAEDRAADPGAVPVEVRELADRQRRAASAADLEALDHLRRVLSGQSPAIAPAELDRLRALGERTPLIGGVELTMQMQPGRSVMTAGSFRISRGPVVLGGRATPGGLPVRVWVPGGAPVLALDILDDDRTPPGGQVVVPAPHQLAVVRDGLVEGVRVVEAALQVPSRALDASFGPPVAAWMLRGSEVDPRQASTVRLNPTWYSLDEFPPALLTEYPAAVWLWLVDRHGTIRLGLEDVPEEVPLFRHHGWSQAPDDGLAEHDAAWDIRSLGGIGHPTLAVEFGPSGSVLPGPPSARIGGELQRSPARGVWTLTDGSGRYGQRRAEHHSPSVLAGWLVRVARQFAIHLDVPVAVGLVSGHVLRRPPTVPSTDVSDPDRWTRATPAERDHELGPAAAPSPAPSAHQAATEIRHLPANLLEDQGRVYRTLVTDDGRLLLARAPATGRPWGRPGAQLHYSISQDQWQLLNDNGPVVNHRLWTVSLAGVARWLGNQARILADHFGEPIHPIAQGPADIPGLVVSPPARRAPAPATAHHVTLDGTGDLADIVETSLAGRLHDVADRFRRARAAGLPDPSIEIVAADHARDLGPRTSIAKQRRERVRDGVKLALEAAHVLERRLGEALGTAAPILIRTAGVGRIEDVRGPDTEDPEQDGDPAPARALVIRVEDPIRPMTPFETTMMRSALDVFQRQALARWPATALGRYGGAPPAWMTRPVTGDDVERAWAGRHRAPRSDPGHPTLLRRQAAALFWTGVLP